MNCNISIVKSGRYTSVSVIALAMMMVSVNVTGAQELAAPTEKSVDDVITVTATRSQKSAKAIPSTITLIGNETLEDQLAISSDIFSVLGNLVPSLSPSRQKLSSSGESFRGRKPLYLIDGVPQSNPLRDGSRSSHTIDPFMIERVEVIHGSNAIQGLGATGGIINYITKGATKDGQLEQRAGIQLTMDDDLHSDGYGYKGFYSVAKKEDRFDYFVSGSYHKRGINYDGNDRIVGLYATQGDLMDSNQFDIFGKIGYEVTDTGKVSLMLNRFRVKGTDGYVRVNGDRANDIPTTATKGTPEGTPPTNDAFTSSLSYEDSEFARGNLLVSAYYQQFAALYGGGVWPSFQDPAFEPFGELYEQSRNTSRKVGLRTTYGKNDIAGTGVDIITGIDWLNDKTFQELYTTKRKWVPETKFNNIAPFIQLDRRIADRLTLTGGVRFEYAELSAGDYQTLAGNTRNDADNPWEILTVEGGKQSFNDALINGGAVFDVTEEVSIFGSYSQGFTMADVGRVLRAVSMPSVSVDTLLDLEPVVSDNLEAGIGFDNGTFNAKASYFISKSDLGARLSANSDGIFSVNREKTRIKGFEFAANLSLGDAVKIGGNYSNIEGHYDSDGDLVVDRKLSSLNISPDTINIYLEGEFGDGFKARLQSSHYLSRSFDVEDSNTYGDFAGYTLLDFSLSYQSDIGRFTLGIENLLDEYYVSYNGQTYAFARDDRFFSGKGRSATLGYMVDF